SSKTRGKREPARLLDIDHSWHRLSDAGPIERSGPLSGGRPGFPPRRQVAGEGRATEGMATETGAGAIEAAPSPHAGRPGPADPRTANDRGRRRTFPSQVRRPKWAIRTGKNGRNGEGKTAPRGGRRRAAVALMDAGGHPALLASRRTL